MKTESILCETMHPWMGTQHCLREWMGNKDYQCWNDHTGCIWNDGHNTCMFHKESLKQFDSPLKQKDENSN